VGVVHVPTCRAMGRSERVDEHDRGPVGGATAPRPGNGAVPRPRDEVVGAVVGIAAPLLLVGLLGRAEDPERLFPGAMLLGLVTIVSWRAGLRAGALAAASATLGSWFGISGPRWSFRLHDGTDLAGLVLLAALCGTVVAVVHRVQVQSEVAERAQVRSGERAGRLLAVAEAVAAATSREEVAGAVAEAAVEGRASWAAVIEVADVPPRLHPLSITSTPGAVEPVWQDIPLDSPTPLGDCARTGRAVYLRTRSERLTRYPDAASSLDPRRRSWAYLPLRDDLGATTGVLAIGWEHDQPFDPEDRSFLQALAHSASVGLNRFAARQQAELVHLATALDHMIDGIAISTAVRDADGRIVDFAIGYFKPVTMPPGTAIEPGGAPRSLLEMFPMMRDSPLFDALVRVVQTRVAEVLESYDMPVTVPGRPDGLTVYVQISAFGDGLLVVTRDITDRARIDRELRESRRMLEAAQRIARIGSWRVDTSTVTLQLSAEMLRILGFDPAGPPPGVDDLLATIHVDDRSRLIELIGGVRAAPRAFRAELRVVRPDGTVLRAVAHGDFERGTGDNGSPIARPTAWWGTLQDVTAQREAQEEVRRQHALVEQLQRAIIPEELPTVEGVEIDACYRPAGTEANVGGDWYDVVPLADGTLLIAVGDVAGHGVRSAATMTSLRNATRAYAWDGLGPGEILDHLHQLADGTAPGTFATVILGIYDTTTRRLRWASAGHPPPLLLHGDDATLLSDPVGPPIGVDLRPSRHPEHETTLAPESVLVLYTDGLVERRGEVLDDGLDRLVAAATALHRERPGVTCGALVDRLVDASHGDDVCVVSLRTAP
jgi:PAS domain-containing protein